VLSFVLGGLWYGPLFAKTWMRLVGVTEATLRHGFNPAKTYGVTFVLAFLASVRVRHVPWTESKHRAWVGRFANKPFPTTTFTKVTNAR
jgi:hypothetical protein